MGKTLTPFYVVEKESDGCDKCGHGNLWCIIRKRDDCAIGEFFEEKEEAEQRCRELNAALAFEISHSRVRQMNEALLKLANPNFDWSMDCKGSMSYDEWVIFTAAKARGEA